MLDTTPLYHYTKMESAIKILESGVLKPSNVSKLNDIFDFYNEQSIFVDLTNPETKQQFAEELAKTTGSKAFISQKKDLGNTRNERRIKLKEIKKQAEKLKPSTIQNNLHQQLQDYHEIPRDHFIDSRMSFISFTKANPQLCDNSALLWAYYGDGMRGCAFEFEVTSTEAKYLYTINYTSTRPNVLSAKDVLELAKAASFRHEKLQEKYMDNIFRLFYCRKYTPYSWEQEIRHLTPHYFDHSLQGNEYLPINLKAIHVGIKADKNQISKLIATRDKNCPNVQIRTYKPSKYFYTIEECSI